jgi:hypothetical protein
MIRKSVQRFFGKIMPNQKRWSAMTIRPTHRALDQRGHQIRCAVQVPEHMAPRQVPEPEVPDS